MKSSTSTKGVLIEVESEYLSEKSLPEESEYLFTYHVTITNNGDQAVQLRSRHWIITDANGLVDEVKGPGVVGLKPLLEVGESFNYSSFCPLKTEIGTMHGSYQMYYKNGESFDAIIDPFRLEVPGVLQ